MFEKILDGKGKWAFAIVLTGMAITGCGTSERWQAIEGCSWNTVYHVKYLGDPSLKDSVTEVFNIVDASLSVFNPASLVAAVNSSRTTAVDSHFINVFNVSRLVSEWSKGAFDPTVGPLIDLWGFGLKDSLLADSLITPVMIDSVMQSVGIAECRLQGDTIIKKSGDTRFNFSAIAKGYGCDLMAEMFRRNNVDDFMIEIGGELSLGGTNPRGREWVVQIDAPTEGYDYRKPGIFKVSLSNCGVATSGNYRNNRKLNQGKRIGHTINALTGYPIQTEMLSATIIAASTTEADALATACMAMPIDEACRMISEISGVEAMFVLDAGVDETTVPEAWRRIQINDGMMLVCTGGFPQAVE